MNIVAFGDSITEGVVGVTPEENWLYCFGRMLKCGFSLVSARYGTSEIFGNDVRHTLVNAGIGGNSARECMARFEKDVLSSRPDCVLLEFGGNNHDPENESRRVNDTEFRMLLTDFRRRIPEGCRVIAVTFPPVVDEWHAYGRHPAFAPNGLDSAINSQRRILREFADEHGFPLLDLYSIISVQGKELILPDGVHLNAKGNKVFAVSVYKLFIQKGWII